MTPFSASARHTDTVELARTRVRISRRPQSATVTTVGIPRTIDSLLREYVLRERTRALGGLAREGLHLAHTEFLDDETDRGSFIIRDTFIAEKPDSRLPQLL